MHQTENISFVLGLTALLFLLPV